MEYKDRITELARFDPWYQRCLKDVQEKEQAFLAIHEMLTEEQQLQLDLRLVHHHREALRMSYEDSDASHQIPYHPDERHLQEDSYLLRHNTEVRRTHVPERLFP